MSPFLGSANHFLASLSAEDSLLLEPRLRPMELPHGAVLFRTEDTIDRIYFPHNGVVSLVVGLANGQFVEAGMFGRNSVIGAGALLDGPFALNQAIGQVGGQEWPPKRALCESWSPKVKRFVFPSRLTNG